VLPESKREGRLRRSPELPGQLTGQVTGQLTGQVTGQVTGQLTGQLTGQVTGQLTGGFWVQKGVLGAFGCRKLPLSQPKATTAPRTAGRVGRPPPAAPGHPGHPGRCAPVPRAAQTAIGSLSRPPVFIWCL